MYAVIKTGGKQYRVEAGDVLRVEKIAADAGEKVQFNDVLMLGGDGTPKLGAPLVDGAAVQAEVLDHIKGPKTINYVRRRRKHSSKRTKGHRQNLTVLRVTDVVASGGSSTGIKAAIGAAGLVFAGAAAAAVAVAVRPEKARKTAKGTPAEGAVDAVADAVETGSRPSNLMDSAPEGGADDLKRLSGVGPKLETKLHENGVYTFAQIAEWGADDIAWMDDKLSFKGRIEREGWVEQAKTLAAEKE